MPAGFVVKSCLTSGTAKESVGAGLTTWMSFGPLMKTVGPRNLRLGGDAGSRIPSIVTSAPTSPSTNSLLMSSLGEVA